MKIKYIVCLMLLYSLSMVSTSQAQEVQFGIDLEAGIPQGDFNDQMNNTGWGLDLTGGYRFFNTPFMLGLELGYMNFGTDRREEPLSTTIPDLRVEVKNSYNLVHGDLLLRVITPESMFRPFLDGLVGFNYFYTETVLEERGSERDYLRDTNFEDTALNYGFGGGVQIKLYHYQEDDFREGQFSPRSIYLNLTSRYMFGQKAEYLQEGSIYREDGEVYYDVSYSTTDLLYLKIGVVAGF